MIISQIRADTNIKDSCFFILKIAPVHSYIDSRNFSTAEKLAEYLVYLDRNNTAYAEYFEWKKFFRVNQDGNFAYCQLCKALNDATMPEKVYVDMPKWFEQEANCIKSGNFPWSKFIGN
jgi:hypothetical protein